MQLQNDRKEVVFRHLTPENLACVRVEVDQQMLVSMSRPLFAFPFRFNVSFKYNGAVRFLMELDPSNLMRSSGLGSNHSKLFVTESLRLRLHQLKRAIADRHQFRFEHIDCPGQGDDQEQRGHEQSRIEMPSPDNWIKTLFLNDAGGTRGFMTRT